MSDAIKFNERTCSMAASFLFLFSFFLENVRRIRIAYVFKGEKRRGKRRAKLVLEVLLNEVPFRGLLV